MRLTAQKKRALKKNFIEALTKTFGIVTQACKIVGIERPTYYNWREKDEEFRKACDEVNEYVGDFVESKIIKKIDEGDTTMIIFYAKTKLKSRGYTERTEVTGADGKDLYASWTDEELEKRIAELERK